MLSTTRPPPHANIVDTPTRNHNPPPFRICKMATERLHHAAIVAVLNALDQRGAVLLPRKSVSQRLPGRWPDVSQKQM
jgi:hypothetical protein